MLHIGMYPLASNLPPVKKEGVGDIAQTSGFGTQPQISSCYLQLGLMALTESLE